MRKRSYEEETLQVTCGEPGGAQLSGSVSSYSTSPAAWESAREATPRRELEMFLETMTEHDHDGVVLLPKPRPCGGWVTHKNT